MNITKVPLAVMCLLHVATQIRAQESDSIRLINVDEIVITGSKTAVNRNNVPLTVTVVSNEKIENSSESALLPVLSDFVPGLFVTQRGITGFGVATGAAGQITMRGIGGNPNTQVLVLLNGNPQFMGIMGHPLADAYVASDVEKVEVIRGPASTLYGTNAMGGVINIITREQNKEGYRANARFMFGSYGTQKYMINGGYRKKRFDIFASFNHDQTDGYRDSSDFSINNGYIRTGLTLNKQLKINADFSLAHFKATDPGPENLVAGNSIDIYRGMGAIVFDNNFSETNGSLRFFYNFGKHNISDGFHSTDNNYGLIAYQTFRPFRSNTITLGADFKNYGGIAENTEAMGGTGVIFGDTAVRELAGYVYFQQELFEKLILNAGFRLEHHSVYNFEPVPTVGFSYSPAKNTTIKASVAKGFRSPTIRELYLFTPANADLKPEQMINYEMGIMQRLFKTKLNLELTVFKSVGNNLIQTVMGTNGPRNENAGEFSNTGIELSANYIPFEFVKINANYSYISMEEPILSAPEQQLNINGSIKVNKFSFNISAQHVHNLNVLIVPQKVKESYTLLNTRIAYSVFKIADVFLKGENLTDNKYYINYGYPMPGFIFFGGINLHLD